MKVLSLTLLSILISSACPSAQPPDTLWTRTFGDGGYSDGPSVQQTTDGGFLIAGSTNGTGAGSYDVYLIKTDTSGMEQWSHTFGGGDSDCGSSAQQTTDGAYIVVGYTHSFGAGNADVWLLKTDADGDTLWTKTFGGSSWDSGNSVQQTSDGGYVVTGRTDSYGAGGRDVYLIKTDALGVEQWDHTYGGTSNDEGYSIQQTTDGGYIIAGYTSSYGAGSSDAWLIKTNASGAPQWSRTFGENRQDGATSVQQTSDGGYVIAGWYQPAVHLDAWLIKTDSLGVEEWNRALGGSNNEWGRCVRQTAEGGYIVAGDTESYGAGLSDVYIVKTDAAGIEEWSGIYGSSYSDYGMSVRQTGDGGYILSGAWHVFAGFGSVWLIRLGHGTEVAPSDRLERVTECMLTACPNPFNPSTWIRFRIPKAGDGLIRVYDINGNFVATVADGWFPAGWHQVPFNAKGQFSGIYFAHVTVGDFTQTEKLVRME